MKIYRMTFEIAVKNDAPDVYTIADDVAKNIGKEGYVIGAEIGKGNGLRVNGIDASAMIDMQNKVGRCFEDEKPMKPLTISAG